MGTLGKQYHVRVYSKVVAPDDEGTVIVGYRCDEVEVDDLKKFRKVFLQQALFGDSEKLEARLLPKGEVIDVWNDVFSDEEIELCEQDLDKSLPSHKIL